MKSPLRILHLEDDPNDAALVLSTLRTAGILCTATRVQTQGDFVAELEDGSTDLVISDYSLPTFDGLSATKIVRDRWPELPVILVSGTRGEELAIDSLKTGATDYVLKERLTRLPSAVLRAMQEVEAQTERLRLEAQLIEAQKMEVVGQLAGGVAHDFNNLLSVIMGYSDFIECDAPADSPIRNYVEQIQHASERAASLTRQLLVFSSQETVHPVVLDLNEVLRDLDGMLRRLIDENIEMTVMPGASIGRIKADAGYAGQLLMNLVVNARDAMPNGGELTIRTRNVRVDEDHLGISPAAMPGNYVVVSVSDTGTGMSDEVKGRLFDAFFTTKPKGKGTGLGLATCRTIVKQSDGYIELESEIGKGTTFEIYFPQVEQAMDAAAASLPRAPLPSGSETLLLVEDEPAVRNLARSILAAQGYVVLTATNGEDALHVFRAHQGPPIRLVVTDLIMPIMGGKVMAEWLKTSDPGVRILFTSGYSEDAISRHGVFEPGVEFLAKPYTPRLLVGRVRELLDNKALLRHEPTNGMASARSASG